MTLTQFFNEYWSDLSQLFSNSQQRLYWGYILSAAFIAFIWSIVQNTPKQSFKTNLRQSVGWQQWLSTSSLADFKIILINKAIFLLCLPLLLSKLTVATLVFEWLHLYSSQRSAYTTNLSTTSVTLLFTVFIFIFDDFARFYLHKLMHQWPWLWQFHKTHHSATALTPLTVLRTHPVEGLIFSLRSALVQGLSIAVFIYFFDDKVDLYTVLNVNIILFIFNTLGANLRHTHVHIRYWRWLEFWLISPAQHQIHHSTLVQHFDKNYGAMIAVWDKIFKTHCYSQACYYSSQKNQITSLKFGLNSSQDQSQHTLYQLYIQAFVNIFHSIKHFSLRFFIKDKTIQK